MNVTITVSNLPVTFTPDRDALKRLLDLVKRYYHSPVTLLINLTSKYSCDEEGNLSPTESVEVNINPTTHPGEKRPPSKDFSDKAGEICLAVSNLLLSASMGNFTFTLPSMIKIIDWNREKYHFRNGHPIEVQEWRG